MKNLLLGVVLMSLGGVLSAADAPAPVAAPAPNIWQGGRPRREEPNPQAKLMPLISVRGNHFVDPSGQTVLFRGVSIADPDKLVGEGQWNRALFVAVKDCGADLVRLPVHPAAWRARTPVKYLELLDQAVAWCTELHMYVIIDWHSIGNLKSGMYQAPMYDTSIPETFDFWRTIARHFRGHNTVAFYELFNEPTHFNGMLGSMSWTEWRNLNEEMIDLIRFWDKERIPLVAGFDWAYDLDFVHYEPVRADGIGYVTHPYANKRTRPWEPKWEENFGFVADKYPMIATEIGFDTKPGEVVDDDHYGNRITRFLESHGISWCAWVFDPEWGPAMLKTWKGYELSGGGEFFKAAMHRPPATKPAAEK